jgi:hypothetical protein
MNLPNYFLADCPPEAPLSAAVISEACQTLKRNREHYLKGRSTASLVGVLCELAHKWLQPDYPFRKMALEMGPAATGFSDRTLSLGLKGFFGELTPANFHALLEQELGNLDRLDEPSIADGRHAGRCAALAKGPELLAHIAAGVLPNPIFMSMVLGLLLRSAQFVKCASGASLLPRLFAHSLYELEPKLGACLEIAEWRGGTAALESALFAETDCVTATGSDETLAALRQRVPHRARFVGYGHRLSFGYLTGQVLSGREAACVVERAVDDVVAWNQMGCLSPHVFYAERGTGELAERFAERLAAALAAREQVEPRGPISVEAAAHIATRRAFYEVRAAHSPDTRHWFSPQSTAWTVIYESDPRFQTSCLNRFIYVKGVADLTEALQGADSVRHNISTVGLASGRGQEKNLANELARWGAPRICPLGQMQNPPLTWRHDGRPVLGDLLTWTDWEPP